MVGKGRPGLLAVYSPDPLLSALAAFGLASSAGSGLVIDVAGGLATSGKRSLADIAAEGPRLDELSPGRSGVAVISGGPITMPDAAEAVERLTRHWPAIVIRARDDRWPAPTVPIVPLLPGLFQFTVPGAAVWQPIGGAHKPPGPGPVMPRLPARTARSLLGGRLPGRSRWMSAWSVVWELPWA